MTAATTTQVNKVHSVRTLALVTRDLGTDEDSLAELANGMDREAGLIWVYGIDDEDGTMAFTDIGVETFATLIGDLGSSRSRRRQHVFVFQLTCHDQRQAFPAE